MDEPLLTPDELAEWLQVPVGTLSQWRHRGVGPPATKVGRHVRYDRETVKQWLTDQTDREPAASTLPERKA